VALPGPGLSVDAYARAPAPCYKTASCGSQPQPADAPGLDHLGASAGGYSEPVEKMAPAVTDAQVIAAAVAAAEAKIRREFLAIVARLRDQRSIAQIAELIREHRVLEMVDDARAAGAELAAIIGEIYSGVAKKIAAHLTVKTGTYVAFDPIHERVIAEVKRNAAYWVRELTSQQRGIITDVVTEGVRAGAHPSVSARAIKRSIGLTQHQHGQVQNFRRLLEASDREALTRALRDKRFDRTVERAIADSKPLTRGQVDKMVAAYERRYIAFRAQTIAQTEAIGAAHRAQEEIWQQAVERGDIDGKLVECRWVPGPARKHRREFHQSMRGQKRAWGVPFTSGQGNSLRYPHDPAAPLSEVARCACARTVRLLRAGSVADA